jgi:4-hydroxy-tetrahydrodipicolinate synthase
MSIVDAFPGFAVFPGAETNLAKALAKGAAGCISATANINARAIRHLFDQWNTADADRLQAEVNAVRIAIERPGLIPAVKAVLAVRYGRPAWSQPRPPLLPLDAASRSALLAEAAVKPLLAPVPA